MSGDEVVILGAGFSHAASSSMPLVKELGDEVLDRLRADGDRSEGLAVLLKQLERALSDNAAAASPGFETWLARLAEDQPYVSQRENLERRALFSRVSEIMWEVMVERQDRALTSSEENGPSFEPREWLYDVVSLFHQRRTTVITLNYDNLVEHAAASSALWGEPTTPSVVGRAVRADDLFDGLPSFLPSVDVAENLMVTTAGFQPRWRRVSPTVPTFPLLKLHGSLSWFWIPTDPSGATLAAWNVADLGRGLRDKEARRRDLPGREPFLVPPTTSKASYFETMVTRELWRRAFEALKVTRRVVLVGYSLPAADSTLLGLLADTIVGRDVEVVVVNRAPGPVKTQLERLGVESHIAEVDDVATWVDEEVRRDSRQVADQLRSFVTESASRLAETNFVVGWMVPPSPTTEVYTPGVRIDGSDELVLGTRPSEENTGAVPNALGRIGPLLDGVSRISAELGGRRVTLTQLRYTEPPGAGMRGSIHLFPVGRPGGQ